jgi:hypothetical protein
MCGGCAEDLPQPGPETGRPSSGHTSGPAFAPPDGAGPELFVEEGLPNGKWNGELAYAESDEPWRWVEYYVSIRDNTVSSESIGNGYAALARNVFDFTDQDSVVWRNHRGEFFGRCRADGNTLSCSSDGSQRFQVSLDFAFYEHLLVWRESGSLDGRGYEREGALYSY